MKSLFNLLAGILLCTVSLSQSTTVSTTSKQWTETDRAYLVDNLTRSRDELIKETKGLTDAQWNFKESPDRWSIAQIVDHIAIWELLMQREISQDLNAGPHPELAGTTTDEGTYSFIMETNKHFSNEYTKPFTFAQPSSQNGPSALEWLLRMRNESINFVKSTDNDLRTYYLLKGRGNIHQIYIVTFGHLDRHLRQIKKVKSDPNYPK